MLLSLKVMRLYAVLWPSCWHALSLLNIKISWGATAVHTWHPAGLNVNLYIICTPDYSCSKHMCLSLSMSTRTIYRLGELSVFILDSCPLCSQLANLLCSKSWPYFGHVLLALGGGIVLAKVQSQLSVVVQLLCQFRSTWLAKYSWWV